MVPFSSPKQDVAFNLKKKKWAALICSPFFLILIQEMNITAGGKSQALYISHALVYRVAYLDST